MKLIEWFFCSIEPDEEFAQVSVGWFIGEDRPLMYFPKPDRDYWSSFSIRVVFMRRCFWFSIRLKRLPYRNKQEFLTWLRAKRKEAAAEGRPIL